MSLMREIIANIFRKPFTRRYPKEPARPFERFRGKLIYYPEKCVGCQLCARNCPSSAIKFFRKGKIDFDLKTCMQCGLCVDVCPTSAIAWDTKFDNADKRKESLVVR